MKIITPEEVGFSSQRLARINTKMQRYVDEQKLAGISTLIARRGKVVHFEQVGMADCEAGTPMRADTIFRIYSMTKPITSMAVLMLMEESCFRLSDPVADYLPAFKGVKVLDKIDGNGALPAAAACFRRPGIIYGLPKCYSTAAHWMVCASSVAKQWN